MDESNMPEKPKFTSKEIRDIVYEIRNDPERNPTKKREKWLNQYRDFAVELPALFNSSLNDSFSLSYLDFMLEQLESLKAHKDVNKADEIVIGKLRKQYVDPLVEKMNLPKEDANV